MRSERQNYPDKKDEYPLGAGSSDSKRCAAGGLLKAEVSTSLAFASYRRLIEESLSETLDGVSVQSLLSLRDGQAVYGVSDIDIGNTISLASALESRLGADRTVARGVTLTLVVCGTPDTPLAEVLESYISGLISNPATDSVLAYEMRREVGPGEEYSERSCGGCRPPVLEMDGIFTARLYPASDTVEPRVHGSGEAFREVWLAHATVALEGGDSVDLQVRASTEGDARSRLRRAVRRIRVTGCESG